MSDASTTETENDFGRVCREYGISQRRLAKMLGYHPGQLNRIINGLQKPTLSLVYLLESVELRLKQRNRMRERRAQQAAEEAAQPFEMSSVKQSKR